MSQRNQEILGVQWIVPSPVESEDLGLIFPEDPIPPEDFISPEDPIPPEDSFPPEGFLPPEDSPPERRRPPRDGDEPPSDVDRLPIDRPRPPRPPRTVNALHNPGLQIDILTGMPNQARVTATVRVELSPGTKFLIESGFVDIILQSTVWGIDGNIWNGGNDHLFDFPNQIIYEEGNYTFSRVVPRRLLNEDHSWFNRDDEISATIRMVSSDSAFPINIRTSTPIIRGEYS